jgi:SAM-dependent methyltransferase
MLSLGNPRTRIIEALKKSPAIGSTAKQIAIETDLDEALVACELARFETEGNAIRFGRGLWLPAGYEDISSLRGFVPSSEYDREFKNDHEISFSQFKGSITFSSNLHRPAHRWSSYVQGFSADFVDQIIERHKLSRGDLILDCFSGSGTSPLCAKLKGNDAIGVDMSPLMTFVSSVKTKLESKYLNVELISKALSDTILTSFRANAEVDLPFLKETRNQFSYSILESLCAIRRSILTIEDENTRDLFLLAFSSVLIECSNLKRSPCLGYSKNQVSNPLIPYELLSTKLKWMIDDLRTVQAQEDTLGSVKIVSGDSVSCKYRKESVSLAVTSPPYANGLDYVTNYKIEMAWLGKAKSYEDLRNLRDSMVACDNVSRGSLERYFDERSIRVHDPWLDEILLKIERNVESKTTFRRRDMHLVIKKYFEDMFDTFENVYDALLPGGNFVFVIGDSLTAGTYLPTDLILTRMGHAIGFGVSDVELARVRRSGQRRNFKLRETIVTLVKPQK